MVSDRRVQKYILYYVPNLIDSEDTELYLVTDYCGKDLRNLDDVKKTMLIAYINTIHNKIVNDYKLYHNDVRWKNITMNNNKIYLIDWGMADFRNIDQNHDQIL